MCILWLTTHTTSPHLVAVYNGTHGGMPDAAACPAAEPAAAIRRPRRRVAAGAAPVDAKPEPRGHRTADHRVQQGELAFSSLSHLNLTAAPWGIGTHLMPMLGRSLAVVGPHHSRTYSEMLHQLLDSHALARYARIQIINSSLGPHHGDTVDMYCAGAVQGALPGGGLQRAVHHGGGAQLGAQPAHRQRRLRRRPGARALLHRGGRGADDRLQAGHPVERCGLGSRVRVAVRV